MKTALIFLFFIVSITLGILVDSLMINWIISALKIAITVPANWEIGLKIALWAVFSFFTGGMIFSFSFVASGAIKTALNK